MCLAQGPQHSDANEARTPWPLGLESSTLLLSHCTPVTTEQAVKIYGKCSKILNTICLPKRSRQTVQTQIRLLQSKQSDQGLPCLFAILTSMFEGLDAGSENH